MGAKPQGFGFRPEESEHHFVVTVPGGSRGDVLVAEHVSFDPKAGHAPPSLGMGAQDVKLRVALPRAKWTAVADEARVEFNRRLRKQGLPPGRWKRGDTPVTRLLGKELTLLAWAVEDADPALIPAAIRNWLGARAGGAMVAVHHDQRRHRPRPARPEQGLAQGGALRADREPGDRRPPGTAERDLPAGGGGGGAFGAPAPEAGSGPEGRRRTLSKGVREQPSAAPGRRAEPGGPCAAG